MHDRHRCRVRLPGWALLALLALAALGVGCLGGSSGHESLTGQFLSECTDGDVCQPGLECICGQCTTACVTDNACRDLDRNALCADTESLMQCGGGDVAAATRVCTLSEIDDAVDGGVGADGGADAGVGGADAGGADSGATTSDVVSGDPNVEVTVGGSAQPFVVTSAHFCEWFPQTMELIIAEGGKGCPEQRGIGPAGSEIVYSTYCQMIYVRMTRDDFEGSQPVVIDATHTSSSVSFVSYRDNIRVDTTGIDPHPGTLTVKRLDKIEGAADEDRTGDVYWLELQGSFGGDPAMEIDVQLQVVVDFCTLA